jgi:hypothetical protein
VEFLKLWNSKTWDVACSLSLDHVLNVKGIFKKDAKAFSVANVYAPCDGLQIQTFFHFETEN